MPTQITFDDSHSIVVDQDLEAVAGDLRRSPRTKPALVKFTTEDALVYVNAALVRIVQEGKHVSKKMVAF